MRITGGEFAGRRLRVCPHQVRPTTDRAREALFSILADRICGARFMDLFAGSGVVGLEALSRGASRVTWVEEDRRIARFLRDNVASVAGKGQAICVADALGLLTRGIDVSPYDIIFADPPYRLSRTGGPAAVPGARSSGDAMRPRLAERIRGGGWLAAGGLFVFEQPAEAAVDEMPGWRVTDRRKYGGTQLCFHMEDPTP